MDADVVGDLGDHSEVIKDTDYSPTPTYAEPPTAVRNTPPAASQGHCRCRPRIGEIVDVITQISDHQGTIASAVEEQTATTAEMNRNVADAVLGSGQIADNVGSLAETASVTSKGVAQTRAAVSELSSMAVQLREQVARFRVSGLDTTALTGRRSLTPCGELMGAVHYA